MAEELKRTKEVLDSSRKRGLPNMTETRPELTKDIDPKEIMRWYWTGEDLTAFAGKLGLAKSGSKRDVAQRIMAFLSGEDPALTVATVPANSNKLKGPLNDDTLVPAHQSCTQELRVYFQSKIGKSFRFDAPMRDFLHSPHSHLTLGDAVKHWYETRNSEPKPIGEQFELNRFSRSWYASNPEGSRSDFFAAWDRYKATPAELR